MEAQNLLIEIGKMSPLIGVMVWVIFYFKNEIKIKNDELKELNGILRDTQKETLTAVGRLTEAVTDLRDIIKEKLK